MKSTVWRSVVAARDIAQRIAALEKLLAKADPFSAYRKDEIVPVKLTIGDTASAHHVAPELVKTVVDAIARRGAKPFLFDTSVIYKGERQNAVDHMNLAERKGFGRTKAGAPFIVADGVFGQDGKEHTIGAADIAKIRTPSFIGMTPSLVVITHVTGHIVSHYAGAIKNVAMGMSCRATKQVQHSSLKPAIDPAACTACGCCIAICPVAAIAFAGGKARIDQKQCVGCGECLCACKFDAVGVNWEEDAVTFCRRMDEVARFILSQFKNTFFINVGLEITKECDCISTKDDPIVSENIGILASHDPVALDKATLEVMVREKRSAFFTERPEPAMPMLEYAAKIGLGKLDYTLITI